MNTNGHNILSIWQDVRSECGYCKGSRAHVLTTRNPIPAFSGEPEMEVFSVVSTTSMDVSCVDPKVKDDVEPKAEESLNESTCSNSYACNFDSVLPMSYQLLIDRGWRRSGKLLYRPKNYSTCCPSYPIRLDSRFFRISKSQKKVLKSFSSALCVEENSSQKGKRQYHETKLEPNDYTQWFQSLIHDSSLRSILKEALYDHLNQKFSDIVHMCDWKVRKVYKVKKHKDYVTSEVILSSSVVPALSGRWKNQIHKMELAQEIATLLQNDRNIQNYKHDHVDLNGTILWNVFVQGIHVHEQSFQLNVVTQMTVYNEYLHQRSLESSKNKRCDTDTTKQKNILDFLKEAKVANVDQLKPPFTLTVRTIPAHVNQNIHNVHELYCKYQHAVHGDDDPFQSQISKDVTITQNNDVDAKIDDSSCHSERNTEETYSDANALKLSDFEKKYSNLGQDQVKKIYKNYCSFHRFLCSSPMTSNNYESVDEAMAPSDDTWDMPSESVSPFHISPSDVNVPYGTYHQQYLINDTVLIAVGIVDILPNCLSSVYSLYDPILSEHLNLGKLTALYEIEWVKHASRLRPNLKYYYLGYYIHSCQKMRYKAEYKPSEIICPARGKWVNFDVGIQRLDRRSPIRHCCDISTPDEQENDVDSENAFLQKKEEDKSIQPIRNMQFDIGYGSLLTIDKLTPDGVELLQPILEKFVAEAGSEVAEKSIIKFC